MNLWPDAHDFFFLLLKVINLSVIGMIGKTSGLVVCSHYNGERTVDRTGSIGRYVAIESFFK